jgi:ketosteroid isomerase-like protein
LSKLRLNHRNHEHFQEGTGTLNASKAEADIRAQRLLTNELIAAHDADKLKPFFDPEVTVIAGDGRVISGRDAVLGAFQAQFGDPAFIAYVRTTETVLLDKRAQRAAERGEWVGSWRAEKGSRESSGHYLAVWKKAGGKWVIESELFVTLI